MKRKIVTALLIGTLAVSLPANCFAETTAETESAEDNDTAKDSETAEDTEEELKTIGEEKEGCLTFTVKNSSKRKITGIAVKSADEAEYPDDLKMEENDVFESGERRELFYTDETEADAEKETREDAAAQTDAASEEENTDVKELKKYSIRLTFDDQTTAELHDVTVEDFDKFVIRQKDGVYYITYTSLETKEKVDTYEAEKVIADQAAAEAQAAVQTQTDQSYEDYDYDYSYEDDDYDYSYDDAEEDYSYDDSYAEDGGDACLDGGLLN